MIVGEDNCLSEEKPPPKQNCRYAPCRPQWHMSDWTEVKCLYLYSLHAGSGHEYSNCVNQCYILFGTRVKLTELSPIGATFARKTITDLYSIVEARADYQLFKDCKSDYF